MKTEAPDRNTINGIYGWVVKGWVKKLTYAVKAG
jgi:hypothetical protein